MDEAVTRTPKSQDVRLPLSGDEIPENGPTRKLLGNKEPKSRLFRLKILAFVCVSQGGLLLIAALIVLYFYSAITRYHIPKNEHG
ncbi:unnamed protein product, partial [Mesorhabditis spiculigera]